MADASPPTTNSGSRLRSSASTDGKLIAAVAELVIGAIVVLYALVTILSDMSGQRGGYRYAFPLTLHEITTIMCLILGAILLFVGYAQWKTRNEK